MPKTEGLGFQQVIPQEGTIYGLETKFPTPDQMERNHQHLMVSLSGQINSEGKRSYTDNALSSIFGYPEKLVTVMLEAARTPVGASSETINFFDNNPLKREHAAREIEVSQVNNRAKELKPDQGTVITGVRESASRIEREILPNERAYFLGLGFNNFSRELVKRRGKEVIKISSRASDPKKVALLESTLGSVGESVRSKHESTFYLNRSQFGFMNNPFVDDKFLGRKERLYPFLLGLLNIGLSEKEARLSISDGLLLRKIVKHFEEISGVKFGEVKDVKLPRRDNEGGRYVHIVPTLLVEDPEAVYGELFKTYATQQLPFVKDLPGYRNQPQNS